MTDILDDVRPVAALLDLLRPEGVRSNNADQLRRQLAEVWALIDRYAGAGEEGRLSREESEQALAAVLERFDFACEAQTLLDESITATKTFLAMRLDETVAAQLRLDERQRNTDQVLRARPVRGTVDHAALTEEIIARYPKILAALAK